MEHPGQHRRKYGLQSGSKVLSWSPMVEFPGADSPASSLFGIDRKHKDAIPQVFENLRKSIAMKPENDEKRRDRYWRIE